MVRVLAFMAIAVTVGWFIALIIMPAIRSPEYRPAPEITTLLGTVFTGLAGSLGVAAYKARKAGDDRPRDDEDTTTGSGRRPADDNDTGSGDDHDDA